MHFDELKQFKQEKLSDKQLRDIKKIADKSRYDTLKMINEAGSGHIGGSLSSTDLYLMLWLCADVCANDIQNPYRDKIVVSHGHTSAGLYSVLGNLGYFDIQNALDGFRKGGSIYEGHPSLKVPGVEWCSGSLGQGLSVGCGFALASKMKKISNHVFVVMGDGEQGKGQIQEAREFAVKYGLDSLTAIVDYNKLQASGSLNDVMPQNIADKYFSAGWRVLEINGHDYNEIYIALKECYSYKIAPTVIIAHTTMGKGALSIENNYEYHGKILSAMEYEKAIVGFNGDQCMICKKEELPLLTKPNLQTIKQGIPITYDKDKKIDCRTAFGEALVSIARENIENSEIVIAAVDCDLKESVKLTKYGDEYPENLVECGIQEHNAVTVASALSKSGIITFFADFGVFGIDETYGQHRMADLNNTSLKLICTHMGLDVGEDGKTHQCIDYIGVMSNLFGYKIILPADVNQTDRAIRYAASTPGNLLVAMGRSKLSVLTNEDENVFYDENYIFEYGKAEWIRKGNDAAVITFGTMTEKAIKAYEILKKSGINIGVLNLSCPMQLDEDKIKEAAKTGLIITYEDHNVMTGIGSIIGTYLMEQGICCKFKALGIKSYGVSATPEYQYKLQSLDEDSLVNIIKEKLK